MIKIPVGILLALFAFSVNAATVQTLPWVQTFAQASDLDDFTIVNSNNDKYTWQYNATYNAAYCPANPDKDANDWLISPPIAMKAGSSYYVEVMLHCKGDASSYKERFVLSAGKTPTAAGMTNSLIPLTTIYHSTPKAYGEYFTPTADGEYYIGLQARSVEDQYFLCCTQIKVEGEVSNAAPGTPTDFYVMPDPNGGAKATLCVTAPALDMTGGQLSQLDKLVFSCGDRAVGEILNPVPGEKYTLVDNNAVLGEQTYSCKAFNAAGGGDAATYTLTVGLNKPGIPANIVLTEEGDTGHFNVSWNTVAEDFNGYPLNPDKVKYNLYFYLDGVLATTVNNYSGNSYRQPALTSNAQAFVKVEVEAVDAAGISDKGVSDMAAMGKPTDGFEESFADTKVKSPLWFEELSDNGDLQWNVRSDGSYANIASQDLDNGFLICTKGYKGDKGAMTTGKISLASFQKPVFSFYMYTMLGVSGPSPNIITVKARCPGEQWSTLLTTSPAEVDPSEGWHKVNVDLDAYANKTIQLWLEVERNGYNIDYFDNFRINEKRDTDYTLHSLLAPAEIEPGADYEVKATIINEGMKDAGSFVFNLYADGEKVATANGKALAMNEWNVLTFSRGSHVFDETPVVYKGEILLNNDEDLTNNVKETTVAPMVSEMPKVRDLAGSHSSGNVSLTWTAPDLKEGTGENVMESFESAGSFVQDFKWWTFLDLDKQIVGGFNVEIPKIPCDKGPASWFIFDNAAFNSKATTPPTGEKFLASLFNADDSMVDDWAISPNLSGDAQTITFKAKSLDGGYPESVEVLYSTGGLNPEDFISVAKFQNIPEAWTQYSANLPQGAKRFALRHNIAAMFLLMIDDINYIKGGHYEYNTLLGYDIYRDRVKLNDAILTTTNYEDKNLKEGSYSYQLQAIYAEGKSAGSNTTVVEVSTSGVNEEANQKAVITTAPGEIIIKGASGLNVRVVSMQGLGYYSGVAEDELTVEVPVGIYVVKIGDKSVKVSVK